MKKEVLILFDDYERIFGEYPPTIGYHWESEEQMIESIQEAVKSNQKIVFDSLQEVDY